MSGRIRKLTNKGLSPNGQVQGRPGKGASEVTFNGSLSERTAGQRRRWPFGDSPNKVTWTLILLAGLFASSVAGALDAITTVEGITEYRLKNGLTVLLVPDQTASTVTVNMTYFVGSRHEGYGETGMAHLLEHMLFRRTAKYPLVWQVLSDRGAQFNGTTWVDRTNYFETLPATDENLRFALDLEKERMIHTQIEKADLDKEMTVVRNEFEMGENYPLNILSQRVLSTAFLWHNYGKSTIGSREDIERVPVKTLVEFYRNHYRPDNAMLVVAGRFELAKTLDKIVEIFNEVPRAEQALQKTYTVEPAQDGPREVVLQRVGDIQGVSAVYHICPAGHPDMPALEVLAHILSATETGRLYQALVIPDLATSVWAYAMRLNEPGYMEIGAEVRTEKSVMKVRDAFLEVLNHLDGITTVEVKRAKAQFAKDFHLLLNDSRRVGIVLTESAAAGDWRLMFFQRDRLQKVTPADVQRVARLYLKESNRTLGLFIPTGSPDRTIVPESKPLSILIAGYEGKEVLAEGEEFEATPQNIEARLIRQKTKFGMNLALLPKKTRGQNVNMNLVFHYGQENDFKDKTEIHRLLAPMMMRGTDKMTRREIEDFLNEQKASVSIYDAGLGNLGVTVQTIRPNLKPVLAALGDFLRRSTFPQEEFERLRREQLAGYEQQLSDPTALGRLAMEQKLSPYPKDNVRYVPTIQERMERLQKIRIEDLRKMHREILGANFSEFAMVGDFDPKQVVTQIDKVFSGWKNPKPYQRIEIPYLRARPEDKRIETPDKANAFFSLGMNLVLQEDDPNYEPLFMAHYLLGGRPNSRLILRIRHKEGLSYGVGSRFQASSHEPSGRFSVAGICAPQNAKKAIQTAQEEMDGFLENGATPEELEDAKKSYAEQLKISLAQDASLASLLARDLYLGRKLDFTQKRLETIMALTPTVITQTARKFLKTDQMVVIQAGDFKNQKAYAHAYTHPMGHP